MSKQLQTVHEGYGFNRDVIAMTMPLFLMAFFFYGPRVILLAVVGVITARLCDRLASGLRSRKYDKTENSSVTIALIIVLMMPATVKIRVVVVAVIIAILVAKETFGGYNSYPFNPSAVGFCIAAVSWPEQMLRYPQPQNWIMNMPQTLEGMLKLWSFKEVALVEGPSYVLKTGGLPDVDLWNLMLGNYPGSMGITAFLVIVSCGVYLYVKGRLPLIAPAAFLATAVVIAFVFPRYSEISWQTWPFDWLIRLQVVKFELFSGALLFIAVFMIHEPGTLPKNPISQLIYGILLGFAAMMFRYFGIYELGTSFAILLVNAVSGYFDRAIANRTARRKGVASQ